MSWWTGDANANDFFGLKNGTLINGATIVAGEVGNAFSFDGADDYVQLPTMNIGSLFSIEFWMYPVGAQNYGYLVANSTSGSNFGVLQMHAYNNVIYCPPGGSCVSTPSNSVPVNAWSHLALTYDGSVIRIYVNGVLQATSAQHTMTFNNSLKLGGDTTISRG